MMAPKLPCGSVIQAMVEHILENERLILSQRSGQVILDYSETQVGLKLVEKAGVKKVIGPPRASRERQQ
jgi:hypothetical protein